MHHAVVELCLQSGDRGCAHSDSGLHPEEHGPHSAPSAAGREPSPTLTGVLLTPPNHKSSATCHVWCGKIVLLYFRACLDSLNIVVDIYGCAVQVLAFLEQVLLMYRTIAAVPCWMLYYDSIGMGAFWTSSMHGESRSEKMPLYIPKATIMNPLLVSISPQYTRMGLSAPSWAEG